MKIKKICFSYGENKIINNISLEIEAGQIGVLVGDSGCGKTTLLNLIAGLLMPCSGEIYETENLVYQPQEIRLLPYLTALENAMLRCKLRGDITPYKIALAKKLYADFGLSGDSINYFPSQLSGGMKQRIAIIQSLLVSFSVLLMDEPLSAVDRGTSLFIMDYIVKRVKDMNAKALIVTHDLEQAVSLGDYIFLMNTKGELMKLNLNNNNDFPSKRRSSPSYMSNFFNLINALNNL